jgi:hypothetical protein
MFQANLDAIELVFTGGTGIGLDDTLVHIRKKRRYRTLQKVIKSPLVKCKEEANAISVPLEEG